MLELGVFSIFLEIRQNPRVFFSFFCFSFFLARKDFERFKTAFFHLLYFFCLMNVYKNMKRQTDPYGKAMKK